MSEEIFKLNSAKGSGTKRYTIPRKQRLSSEDCLQGIPLDSREAKEIINTVHHLTWYSAEEFDRNFIISKIDKVENQVLERQFQTKRTELRDDGRSTKELSEHYAFKAEYYSSKVKEQCKMGVYCNGSNDTLGDGSMGVSVWRCPDLCLKSLVWPDTWTIFLVVFRIIKGRVKPVTPKQKDQETKQEPSPNYDCHVCKNVQQSPAADIATLMIKTQYYLYEYDEDGLPRTRPRHCLPFAVIHLNKVVDPVQLETKQAAKEAAHLIQHANVEVSEMIVQETKRHYLTENDGKIAWRGLIGSKETSLGVVAIMAGHKLGLTLWKSFIEVKNKLPLDNLLKVIPGDMRTAWNRPLRYHGYLFSLCVLKPCEPTDKFTSFIKFLSLKDHAAGVVTVDSYMVMFLVPSSKLSVELGFCKDKEPWRMFCIVRRRIRYPASNNATKSCLNPDALQPSLIKPERLNINLKLEVPNPINDVTAAIQGLTVVSSLSHRQEDMSKPMDCTKNTNKSILVKRVSKMGHDYNIRTGVSMTVLSKQQERNNQICSIDGTQQRQSPLPLSFPVPLPKLPLQQQQQPRQEPQLLRIASQQERALHLSPFKLQNQQTYLLPRHPILPQQNFTLSLSPSQRQPLLPLPSYAQQQEQLKLSPQPPPQPPPQQSQQQSQPTQQPPPQHPPLPQPPPPQQSPPPQQPSPQPPPQQQPPQQPPPQQPPPQQPPPPPQQPPPQQPPQPQQPPPPQHPQQQPPQQQPSPQKTPPQQLQQQDKIQLFDSSNKLCLFKFDIIPFLEESSCSPLGKVNTRTTNTFSLERSNSIDKNLEGCCATGGTQSDSRQATEAEIPPERNETDSPSDEDCPPCHPEGNQDIEHDDQYQRQLQNFVPYTIHRNKSTTTGNPKTKYPPRVEADNRSLSRSTIDAEYSPGASRDHRLLSSAKRPRPLEAYAKHKKTLKRKSSVNGSELEDIKKKNIAFDGDDSLGDLIEFERIVHRDNTTCYDVPLDKTTRCDVLQNKTTCSDVQLGITKRSIVSAENDLKWRNGVQVAELLLIEHELQEVQENVETPGKEIVFEILDIDSITETTEREAKIVNEFPDNGVGIRGGRFAGQTCELEQKHSIRTPKEIVNSSIVAHEDEKCSRRLQDNSKLSNYNNDSEIKVKYVTTRTGADNTACSNINLTRTSFTSISTSHTTSHASTEISHNSSYFDEKQNKSKTLGFPCTLDTTRSAWTNLDSHKRNIPYSYSGSSHFLYSPPPLKARRLVDENPRINPTLFQREKPLRINNSPILPLLNEGFCRLPSLSSSDPLHIPLSRPSLPFFRHDFPYRSSFQQMSNIVRQYLCYGDTANRIV